VPGVKTKVLVQPPEDGLRTPMLEGGSSPEIGEVKDLRIFEKFENKILKIIFKKFLIIFEFLNNFFF
jgi:hypothetical protein